MTKPPHREDPTADNPGGADAEGGAGEEERLAGQVTGHGVLRGFPYGVATAIVHPTRRQWYTRGTWGPP